MEVILKVWWRLRSKEVQMELLEGILFLPEGVLSGGTIRVMNNVCVFPDKYIKNVFLGKFGL